MTEQEARRILEHFVLKGTAQRAIQTAKQIGSAWPTNEINLIWLGYEYRIVIE